jgi:DNA polymerase III sliding clamp (beta) subunit (PCNA family)
MLLNKNNLSLTKFASKSETRPELAGVFVTDKVTVATDTFRLVEMTLPADVKVEDYPEVNGKKAMRGWKPFIVPAKELAKIKIPNSKSLPLLNHVAIGYVDANKVEFMTTDLENQETKTLRRIDGEFPEYSKLFPAGEAKVELSVNAEFMADILEVLGKMNSLNSVKIKLYGDNMPVVFEAEGNGQKSRAMLMPLRK